MVLTVSCALFVSVVKGRPGATAAPARSTMQYVTSASPTPTIVISAPLFNHDRPVTITFDAPTAKCASVLMTNDHTNAVVPDMNTNGITGTNAPAPVLTIALTAASHGFGNVFSDNPNSSCA